MLLANPFWQNVHFDTHGYLDVLAVCRVCRWAN